MADTFDAFIKRAVHAPTEIDVELQLRGTSAERLIWAAAKRNRDPAEVLADAIEKMLEEDLLDAVLDDQ